MDRVPFLVATKGPLQGRQYPVSTEGLMVGRDETCDVVIPDAGVSRQHARVLLHNAAVWVQDEGSRNGVFVNGKRVVRHRQLSPGSEMLIGEHAFTLELVAGMAAPEAGSGDTTAVLNATPFMKQRGVQVAVAIVVLLLLLGGLLAVLGGV